MASSSSSSNRSQRASLSVTYLGRISLDWGQLPSGQTREVEVDWKARAVATHDVLALTKRTLASPAAVVGPQLVLQLDRVRSRRIVYLLFVPSNSFLTSHLQILELVRSTLPTALFYVDALNQRSPALLNEGSCFIFCVLLHLRRPNRCLPLLPPALHHVHTLLRL
eukprot:GHRQ01031246.1.p1 GENE.GHRQ01031246.1~~GHRQ01031246.1.p1  ORF type:complete len:177 (-),score=27.38 GHRQ01031246.1:458-955(-)